jgi:hypothetical protein
VVRKGQSTNEVKSKMAILMTNLFTQIKFVFFRFSMLMLDLIPRPSGLKFSKDVKLCIFVPLTHEKEVRKALLQAGVGKIGSFDCCSFSSHGKASFRALAKDNPFFDQLAQDVPEIKIECVCDAAKVLEVIREVKASHPYKEMGFDIYPLLTASI